MISTSEHILKTHKNKVPIICDLSKNCGIILDKQKFIIPRNVTIREFYCILNKYITKTKNDCIILFIKNILPKGTDTIGDMYNQYKENDGFLYITVRKENTFG